jgi:hypothetical protein
VTEPTSLICVRFPAVRVQEHPKLKCYNAWA